MNVTAVMQFSNEASSANGICSIPRSGALSPLPRYSTSTSLPEREILLPSTLTSASGDSPQRQRRVCGPHCSRIIRAGMPSRHITARQPPKSRAFSRIFASSEGKFSLCASPRWVNTPRSGRMMRCRRAISPGWDIPASIRAIRHSGVTSSSESGTPTWEL